LSCYYSWVGNWFTNNFNNILSATSSIATIIAAIIAIYTLQIWRKQQIYGTKFNVLMELEDNYELLLAEYGNTFNWIFQRQKVVFESQNKPQEYRQKLDEAIKNDFEKFSTENKLAVYSRGYELAYCRAIRIFPSVASVDKLKLSELDCFYRASLELIKAECFESKEATDKLVTDFAHKFTGFGNTGRQHFKILRESL